MSTHVNERISALEAELAALKAERPAPVNPPMPRPADPDRTGPRVVTINDERNDLPSLADMRKLWEAVRHRVPEEKALGDPDKPFRGFCAAFRYVSNCGRIAAPNGKYALGWWMDSMRQWLRQRNAMTIDVTGASFIAAVLASGDVLYVPHDGTRGFVWEFCIMPPNHGGTRGSPDAWRKVLSTGQILPPSQPARPMVPASPARVIIGGW